MSSSRSARTAPGTEPDTATSFLSFRGTTTQMYEYVVVYDPEGGFVTGGGSFDSPAGAYNLDPPAAGKASFGFTARYKKGMSVPDGQTQFQFKAGSLSFHSTSYEWVVVAGTRATYRGTGVLNGGDSYAFQLSAIDGHRSGGDGVDRIRMKIWDRTTGALVYDNQVGANDDAAPTTGLTGGSIVIHS